MNRFPSRVAGAGVIRLAAVLLSLVLASGTGAWEAAAQTGGGQALQELEAQVRAGRLDARVFQAMHDHGRADALVIIHDQDLIERAERRRAAAGKPFDDAQLLAQKASEYRARKQAVFAGVTVLEEYEHFGVQYVRFPSPAALRALLAHQQVRGVVRSGENRPATGQSLPLIRQPEASALGLTGERTAVAVLDTGVSYTHNAFGSCTAPAAPSTCSVIFAQDFAPNDGQLDDFSPGMNGHGTNVAGIVVAVAPRSRILALDVFDGAAATDATIIAALNWVVSNKSRFNIVAANMSLGARAYGCDSGSHPYTTVFRNLRGAGVLPVVAAGNFASADDTDPAGGFRDGLSSPACNLHAFSVGAVYDQAGGAQSYDLDQDGVQECADGVTAADRVACFSQSSAGLSLLAPGAAVTAAGITMRGTSQAAPHVSGGVAALASACSTGSSAAGTGQMETALYAGPNIVDPRNGVTKHRLDLLASAHYLAGIGCTFQGWKLLPGLANDIAVGTDNPGTLWLVGTNPVPGGFGIWRWTCRATATGCEWFWQQIDGGAVRIAAGPDGAPWVVNDQGQVYYRAGTTWQFIDGVRASDIGVGADGSVWVVGRDSVVGGSSIYRRSCAPLWTGGCVHFWEQIDGGAVRIAVGPDGMPWVVNNEGLIYRRTAGQSWERLPGLATDIAVGRDGTAYVTGTNPLPGGFGIFRWDGVRFVPYAGSGVHIAAGSYNRRPYVVNRFGLIVELAVAP